eukprot:TRINITY_DN6716_c0_g1_i2.p1 TRINITY_DN6716_c0_g1~~TRINITY_DN6716_c0_g1_i2.p1  ORF type:complete len:932 (+),score=125.15 TRINITY_DN6716_c0_g1_i2:1-2796(+)
MCCTQNVTSIDSVAGNPMLSSLKESCGVSECAKISLESYKTVTETTLYENTKNMCTANWHEAVSGLASHAKLILECSAKLWGTMTMEGVACDSDDDCLFGAKCDYFFVQRLALVVQTNRVCNYTPYYLFLCMDEFGEKYWNQQVYQRLANSWGEKKEVTVDSFVEIAIEHYTMPLCAGDGYLEFRPHYDYEMEVEECEDMCSLLLDLRYYPELQCMVTDNVTCPVDSFCPGPPTPSTCRRKMIYNNEYRNEECTEEKYCNWRKSLSEEECTTDATEKCVLCYTPSYCREVVGWDKERCDLGACITYDSVLEDPINDEMCAQATGKCSYPCPGCSKEECEATQGCNTGGHEHAMFLYGRYYLGMCYYDHIRTPNGEATCQLGMDVFPLGCSGLGYYETEEDCAELGWRWIDRTVSLEECETLRGCFDEKGLLLSKSEEECTCEGQTWRNYFHIDNGTYSAEVMFPTRWEAPEYRSVRTVEPSFNVLQYYHDTMEVVTKHSSLEYSKEGLCRVGPLLDVLSTISCDCGSTEDDCYALSAEGTLVDFLWGCPFMAINHTNSQFNLNVGTHSFSPDYPCKVITASLLHSNFFTSYSPEARLSSHVFTEVPESIYTIIFHHELIVEGQIITHGLKIEWEAEGRVEEPLRLCIPISEDIPKSSLFDTAKIGRIFRHELNGIRIEVNEGDLFQAEEVEGWICSYITEPGDYIGIWIRDAEPHYRSLLAQSITASVIYFLLFGVVLYQIVCILLLQLDRKLQKLLFSCITGLFLVIRAVYFIVYPIGLMEDVPIASYFVFEFPTFLFLIMNSTIIYLWYELSEITRKLENVNGGGVNSIIFGAWVAWNLLILLFFAGFIVAYYVSPGEEHLPCRLFFNEQPSKAKLDVSLAYVIFVAFLSVALAITYIIIGFKYGLFFLFSCSYSSSCLFIFFLFLLSF